MSAWPCQILAPVTVQWGALDRNAGYAVSYRPRQVLDIPPGSLLEAQIGLASFRRVTDAERAQGDCLDHSVLTN